MNRSSAFLLVAGLAGWTTTFACVSNDSPAPGPGLDASFSFDASGFDASGFDASGFDATGIDVNAPDANAADTSLPDAGTPDVAAPPDTGADGAGPLDAGGDTSVADGNTPDANDAGAGAVSSGGTIVLHTTRQGHSSTLLPNGHVLICGGYYGSSNSSSSCDDFDPIANTMGVGSSMNYGRDGHTATTLPNGQILMTGGTGVNDAGTFNTLRNAEIYDPTANTFTIVANPMAEARTAPSVVLSTGPYAGQVLFVAGEGDGTVNSGTSNDYSLDSLELFNPGTDATKGTFTLLSLHLTERRVGAAAQSLPGDGGVLIAGGYYGPGGGPYTYVTTARTLDEGLSTLAPTTNAMSVSGYTIPSVVLPDGRIVLMGGLGSSGYSTTLDLFDPVARSFTSVPLPAARAYFAIALLSSGHVMIAGGVGTSGTLGDVLVFDPTTGTFAAASGTLTPPRAIASATTMKDGRVLISGGQAASGFVQTAVDFFHE